jgi:hypothetical protein
LVGIKISHQLHELDHQSIASLEFFLRQSLRINHLMSLSPAKAGLIETRHDIAACLKVCALGMKSTPAKLRREELFALYLFSLNT